MDQEALTKARRTLESSESRPTQMACSDVWTSVLAVAVAKLLFPSSAVSGVENIMVPCGPQLGLSVVR